MDSNQINTMAINWIIPKKFLCRYELWLGATLYGIVMIFIKLSCIIVATVDMLSYKFCDDSTYAVKRSTYGFSTMAVIFCIMMITVHLWFLWAVKKRKASVVLVWVVATALWLIETACLTVVLLFFYMAETSFASWIMCVIFGIIAFIICLYGVLVGLGLWCELKTRQYAPSDLN